MLNYGFDNVKLTSYDELMLYVTEEDIITYYFGEWEPNKHYIDTHFKVETTPSLYFSYYNQKLKWRRFGLYNSPKDPVEFVMYKFNINFYDALNKIYSDLYIGEIPKHSKEELHSIRSQARDEVNMGIVIQDWKDYDFDFWESYDGITIEQLESFFVNSASEYWANDKRLHVGNARDPLYCYNHRAETGLNSFTAYRPYADLEINKLKRSQYYRDVSFKFRKCMTRNHIMNLNRLLGTKQFNGIMHRGLIIPRDELLKKVLFITSSYKDIIALDVLGIDSIAPHTEEGIINEEVIISLLPYYDYIYIAYDNDDTGVRQSLKITELYKKYNLKYWNVPKSCNECKDPSSVLKYQNKEMLKELIYEKLTRDKILK